MESFHRVYTYVELAVEAWRKFDLNLWLEHVLSNSQVLLIFTSDFLSETKQAFWISHAYYKSWKAVQFQFIAQKDVF